MNKETAWNILDKYFEKMKESVETKLFDIIAHPDAFLCNYPWNAKAEEITEKICDLSLKHDIPLEYNANGLRSDITKYPHFDFFEVVKKKGVKVIVGSDAHHPKLLGDKYFMQCIEEVNKRELNVVDTIFK